MLMFTIYFTFVQKTSFHQAFASSSIMSDEYPMLSFDFYRQPTFIHHKMAEEKKEKKTQLTLRNMPNKCNYMYLQKLLSHCRYRFSNFSPRVHA